jgi:Ca2+-binding EF-hand superfamily protein
MCDLSFSKLDLNGSGSLERDDLTNAMRRQLELARNLVPK